MTFDRLDKKIAAWRQRGIILLVGWEGIHRWRQRDLLPAFEVASEKGQGLCIFQPVGVDGGTLMRAGGKIVLGKCQKGHQEQGREQEPGSHVSRFLKDAALRVIT